MGKLVLLYVTNGSMADARKLAKHLLKKRFIGCANMFPGTSAYRWKGKITEEKEVILIAKTTQKKAEITKKEIINMHPYDTPCVVTYEVNVNKKYFNWITAEVK